MKIIRAAILLLVLLPCSAHLCFAQQPGNRMPDISLPTARTDEGNIWKEFTSLEGRFTASFPGDPTESTQTVKSPGGDVPLRYFTVRKLVEYSIGYADYPLSVEGTEQVDAFLEAVRDSSVKGVGGKLIEAEEAQIHGHPGRLYKVEVPNGYVLSARIFVVKNRLYMMAATTYGKKASANVARAHDQAAEKFFDSLRLWPENCPLSPGPPAQGEVNLAAEKIRKETGKQVPVIVGAAPVVYGKGSGSSSERTISGGVLNGKALVKTPPIYPPIARAARAQGTVLVLVLVGVDGKIIAAQAECGHALLRTSAVNAVRQWQFSPTLLDGKPVMVTGVVSVNFNLQ